MDTIKYLNAFSRLLRWNLSKADAEDAIADYREMLAPYSGKQTSELIERFGTPAQAAKLLREPRSYYRWLAAFGSMLFCLLLPEIALFKTNSFHPLMVPIILFLFVLGILLALICFLPRQGRQKAPIPKGLAPTLLGLLAVTAAGSIVLAGLAGGHFAFVPQRMYGTTAHLTLAFVGTAAVLLGAAGLVNARILDRRWSALYLLALTVLAECALVLALLCSTSLDGNFAGWLAYPAAKLGVLGIAGLAAAGVSLC